MIKDWNDCPAGEDFDEYVARALGWELHDDMWKTSDGFYAPAPHPWSVDLNLAFKLPLWSKRFWRLQSGTFWVCAIYAERIIPDEPYSAVASGIGNTPALAVCRAWLTWRLGNETISK